MGRNGLWLLVVVGGRGQFRAAGRGFQPREGAFLEPRQRRQDDDAKTGAGGRSAQRRPRRRQSLVPLQQGSPTTAAKTIEPIISTATAHKQQQGWVVAERCCWGLLNGELVREGQWPLGPGPMDGEEEDGEEPVPFQSSTTASISLPCCSSSAAQPRRGNGSSAAFCIIGRSIINFAAKMAKSWLSKMG